MLFVKFAEIYHLIIDGGISNVMRQVKRFDCYMVMAI